MSTAQPNKELAAAFKAARRYLSPTKVDINGKHEFICHCLESARDKGEIAVGIAYLAKELISVRLDRHASLYTWLINKHPEAEWAFDLDRYGKGGIKMQATRRAWLNSLIKEFGGRP